MTDNEECPSKSYYDDERSLIEWTNMKEDGSWCENAYTNYCNGCYYCCCGKCGDGCMCSRIAEAVILKKKDEEVSAMIKEMKEQKEKSEEGLINGEPKKKRIIKKKPEEECLDEGEAEHASICWWNAMGDFTNLPCYYVYRNIYTQLNCRKLSKSEMDLLGEIYSRSGRISSNPFVFRLLPKFQPSDIVP